MAKTHGPTLVGGMRDSLVVAFSLNSIGNNDETKAFGSSTAAVVMTVGWNNNAELHGNGVSGSQPLAFTLPGSYHLDKVTSHGRNVQTSLLATTQIVGFTKHGNGGLKLRVLKSEAATPRTYAQIVDNSIDGTAVVDYILCPNSSATANHPYNIVYKGEPQKGSGGAGSGWTGATADDFSIGDRVRMSVQTIKPTSSQVDMCVVYAHFTSQD